MAPGLLNGRGGCNAGNRPLRGPAQPGIVLVNAHQSGQQPTTQFLLPCTSCYACLAGWLHLPQDPLKRWTTDTSGHPPPRVRRFRRTWEYLCGQSGVHGRAAGCISGPTAGVV